MTFHPPYDIPLARRGYRLPGNKTGLLLLHGFMGSPGSTRPLAEHLHQQHGWTVYAPLLSGHGELPQRLYGVEHTHWLAEAEAAYASLRAEVDQLFVVGHSMGAVLAAHLATRFDDLAGLVLFAPIYHLPDRRLRWLRVLTPLLPWLSPYRIQKLRPLIRERVLDFDPTIDFDDPAQQAWLKQATRLPTSSLVALVNLIEYGQPLWSGLRLPTIVFQGKQDRAIRPAQQTAVFELLGYPQKKLHHLAGGHELMRPRDPAHERVWAETAVFIQQHGPKDYPV